MSNDKTATPIFSKMLMKEGVMPLRKCPKRFWILLATPDLKLGVIVKWKVISMMPGLKGQHLISEALHRFSLAALNHAKNVKPLVNLMG